MTFTEVVTRFRKPSSERTVVEMRSISIHKHPGSAATAAPARPDAAEPGRRDAGGRTALDPFTDAALTITDFVRYQGASGDFNAIHHDGLCSGIRLSGSLRGRHADRGHSGQLRHGPFRRQRRPPTPGPGPVEGSGLTGGRAHLPGLPAVARAGGRRPHRTGAVTPMPVTDLHLAQVPEPSKCLLAGVLPRIRRVAYLKVVVFSVR